MPPAKRLSYRAKVATDRQAKAASRAAETPEQRALRQELNRAATARARNAETSEQRAVRQELNRAATARARAAETPQQQIARQQRNAITMAQMRILPWTEKAMAAFHYNPQIDYSSDASIVIGRMSVCCTFCNALKWEHERKGICCNSGKIRVPLIEKPPEHLFSLLTENTEHAAHFQNNIRKYNSCFQMTSFGTTKRVIEPGFMPTFKVQGQVYHQIGSLMPLQNEEPKFLQIYFISHQNRQAEQRCSYIRQTRQEIVLPLQSMLEKRNEYVRSFKCAMETVTDQYKVVISADRAPANEYKGRFNPPTTSEVAVILAGEQHGNRDIVLHLRDNTHSRIAETHRAYDARQYPLIFWQGQDGYHFQWRQTDPNSRRQSDKKITCLSFYAYRLMVRLNDFNHILRFKDLLSQFIVDMYAQIEAERLRYVRLHQRELRAESYAHLRDAVLNDGNVNNVGKLIILPSSFTGGPRYMHERTQDAITYVRNYGRPDLFITFTCNPSWKEITDELMTGQKSHDRHDLIARVFKLKLKRMMCLVVKGCIFGSVQCYMYTVEWQKRGLPHAHILLWLKEKLHVHIIDDIICAELPDPETDPILHEIVKKNMVHGPCGAINPNSPCMQNNKCTKKYPKQFLLETQTGHDGYPLYHRRKPDDGGFMATITVGKTEYTIDNRWIVPYCPLLSKTFEAHINVEYCNSVKSIKYVCKYVNKGSDMAMFGLSRENMTNDEPTLYEMGRYISTNEGMWRILEFPIHEHFPTVVQLSVHLENGQRVYFTEQNAQQRAQNPPQTTLTAFFDLCRNNTFAQTVLYNQVPKYCIFKGNKKWHRRMQGLAVPNHPDVKATDALGRVYTVHPNNFECFYLRLLLHEVHGPTSFEDLRTVDGIVCNTYKSACQLRGLLEDDALWNSTLDEAGSTRSPGLLRNLFAVMLQVCGLANNLQLWENHKDNLAEDFLCQARLANPTAEYSDQIYNQALIAFEDKVKALGGPDLEAFGLPKPNRNDDHLADELLIERNYNIVELSEYIRENEPLLVPDQREAYNKILHAVFNNDGEIFFLDAPGGTGKTRLINILLAKVRQNGMIAVAVASSGIAATLLTGGKTAHSTFRLPLDLQNAETPTCNIAKGTSREKVLEQCQLIVWDECTMSHRAAFEALDRTLQDIRRSDKCMGGVTLVLAGDFRQTLPVIPRGTKADELHACLKASYIWRNIKFVSLNTNMRVHLTGDAAAGEFAANLLRLGNGAVASNDLDGTISITFLANIVDSLHGLTEAVFVNLPQHFQDHDWLRERAILAPKNDAVNVVNRQLLSQLPGDVYTYKSIDSPVEAEEAVNYPVEFLDNLEMSGVPSHKLELKVGAPIMLLRNLDPPTLCNGTRWITKRLMPHVIEAVIMTGQAAGQDVFIPRIPIIPSDLPFKFKRIQLPVRLCFAVSINKAQGQSLKVVGLNLQSSCFSHGQLYVGCSRVGSKQNLYILAPHGRTHNIVYQEALA